MFAVSHEIIEQYLNETLKTQLAAFSDSDAFTGRIISTVREQMLSGVYHWNDMPFRKALLLTGEEEGSFYLPKADLDVRKFVVVTLRNSALESIHAANYNPSGQGKRLTPDDIKTITAAAIEYFKWVDFPVLSDEINLLENDKYGGLAKKYPISWAALSRIANTKKQIIKYEPIPIITKPNLSILKHQKAVNSSVKENQSNIIQIATEDGYSLTIDHGLSQTLQIVIEDGIPFVVDSFKAVSRNIEKLLTVMEYILGNKRVFITSNYFIANGCIERRLKLLKPGSDPQGMKRNWLNADGITKRHKGWLQTVAEL